ncbi:MAG: hypothetical protein HOE69_00865 [Euryarchaeota archaeon]|jgi:hypothetical protein|nr:hypothetical protein [Euryarchaeota archaeon]
MFHSTDKIRNASISLVLLMLLSTILPLAIAATTETQFADGTTSFSHTFSGQGNGGTAGVNMPYGAEVTSASFSITGTPSTTTWANATSNTDFGGPSTTNGPMNVPYFGYDYRQSISVSNDQTHLKEMRTDATWALTNTNQISSAGGANHNTTGGAIGFADSDLIGATTNSYSSYSGGSWNYAGPTAYQGDDTYVAQWASTNIYQAPTIRRYNSSSGALLGTVSLSYNSCTTTTMAYLSDITSDGNGTVWTTSWNYRYIAKWTVSVSSSGAASWSCQQNWYSSTYNIGGIAFDPLDNNEMYVVATQYLNGNYNYYLWNVNRSSPYQALSTQLLMMIQSGHGQPAGLDVVGDRVTVNVYCTYTTNVNCKARNYHSLFLKNGAWPEHQGDILFPNHAHYGIEPTDSGNIGWTCFYNTQCPSGSSHKIMTSGRSAPRNIGTPTSTAGIITSSAISSSRGTDELTIDTAISWKPTGTTIEYEVTNDGGTTWKTAQLGGKVIFANVGYQLGWRAYLNSTNSNVTPLIDTVSLGYTGSYISTGYMWMRTPYFGGTGTSGPVAAKVWWNSTELGGSYLTIKWTTSSSCTSGTSTIINTPGQTVNFPSSATYLSLCFYFYSGTNNAYSPIVDDLQVSLFSNAPKNVELDIGGDGSAEWTHQNTLLSTVTADGGSIVSALNAIIPDTGSGIELIPIEVGSTASGNLEINFFEITYTMQTVNLNISWDEEMVLHETIDTYEVITRHVIGESAGGIASANLDFLAYPSSDTPSLTWNSDGTLVDDDPEDWIIPDAGATWTNNSNGIMEIHWAFRVTSNFQEQENVGFRVSCEDDQGNAPMSLSTGGAGIRVNQSYGLGWMKVRDNDGAVHHDDVENDQWIKAGESLHFQGAVWYDGTEDAPLDSTFDVAVIKRTAEGDFMQAKDRSNQYGEFFITVPVDTIDRPDGVFYEVQIDNPREVEKVLPINHTWQRTIRVDATSPTLIEASPEDNAYEAGYDDQQVRIRIQDAIGAPEILTLHYWVEAEHDSNRNGVADAPEYVNQTMTNTTIDVDKLFFATINDAANPNMARVSYYVTGTDIAGNALLRTDGPGFDYDLVTYKTRRDMDSVFTGLDWAGHEDGERAFAGTTQYLTLGLVDANGLIDFTDISLIFDFEGPDPIRDRQRLSYSGVNSTFWTDDEFLVIDPACNDISDDMCGGIVTTNDTGLPWVKVTFAFQFSWDWPDADLSDVALEFTQLGSSEPRQIIFTEHTFRVENDLVLDAEAYTVEDVQEPRIGPISDGSRVVPNDRLRWSGRVVYEGSDVPAPRNLGITVEVFDGVQYWSDGSLTDEGGFSLEVPLSAAPTLASSETRTFLAGVRNIPGRGEDMTRDTVSTTLQVEVDHAPPRVLERLSPIDVIDISNNSALREVPVEFIGWEDADLSGSPQWVHWLMRDENQRQISSGSALLGMLQEGQAITWTGTVDLIGDGMNPPLQDYEIGFWVEGWDSAGNPLATEGNSKSDPIREPVDLNGDHELQWINFGALGPQLSVERISADREVVAKGAEIEVTAWITNFGGPTNTGFTVAFYSGDDAEPFAVQRLNGIADEAIPIKATWTAEEGVDRVIVIVDDDDEIIEVDETDNRASVGVSVEYAWGMGWVENARQNLLAVIGIIIAMIVLPIVAFVSMKGAITGKSELFEDDHLFEDDEYEEEEYEEDDYDEDY